MSSAVSGGSQELQTTQNPGVPGSPLTASSAAAAMPQAPSEAKVDAFSTKLLCCGCYKTIEYIPGESKPFSLCGRCKNVWYCNKDCQTKAWDTHKLVCNVAYRGNAITNQINALKKYCGLATYLKEDHQYQPPRTLIPRDDDIVCKMMDEKGVRDITQAEYKKITGTTFVTGPLFSQKALMLAQQNEMPPKYSTRWMPSDCIGLQQQGDMGLGVVALQDIPEGVLVCSFGGAPIHFDDEKCEELPLRYVLYKTADHISGMIFDPLEYASLGVNINDGPPNCRLMMISSERFLTLNVEVPEEIVVISNRQIKKGEAIFIDYGNPHGIKCGKYILSEEAYDHLLASCRRLDRLPSSDKKTDQILILSLYILGTPLALARLCLRGDFDRLPKVLMDKCQSMLGVKNQPKHVRFASIVIEGLKKIGNMDRMKLQKIFDGLSQKSIVNLCQYFSICESLPSLEQCVVMGRIFDEMIILAYGTLNGSYWDSKERVEFESKFLCKEHQDRLKEYTGNGTPSKYLDGSAVPTLPEDFKNYLKEMVVEAFEHLRTKYNLNC